MKKDRVIYLLLSAIQAILGIAIILDGLRLGSEGIPAGYFFVGFGAVFVFVGIKDIILSEV